LRQAAQSFLFTEIGDCPVLSLNRGFSAPIKLLANLTGDNLRFLAARDLDPFNRWQALQTLLIRLLVENVAVIRTGGAAREDASIMEALAAVLSDGKLEPAFVAYMLNIPSEAEIAREIGRDVDPEAVFAARSAMREAAGNRLESHLFDHYRRLSEAGPYRWDGQSAGRRALRNACLDLLLATGKRDAISLAVRQYHADNMTDRMAALSSLALHDVSERATALEDFAKRYSDDPLILDKWFALQAIIAEPATLDRVKALTGHPAFSFANPNRVRALIYAFAQANQKEFNRADGAGYNFVVDIVLMLDGKNPQLAARLLSTLKSWRALEAGRRLLAQAALRRVAEAPSLSPDVRDIVDRALADHP
jgi:aminopeptidase N